MNPAPPVTRYRMKRRPLIVGCRCAFAKLQPHAPNVCPRRRNAAPRQQVLLERTAAFVLRAHDTWRVSRAGDARYATCHSECARSPGGVWDKFDRQLLTTYLKLRRCGVASSPGDRRIQRKRVRPRCSASFSATRSMTKRFHRWCVRTTAVGSSASSGCRAGPCGGKAGTFGRRCPRGSWWTRIRVAWPACDCCSGSSAARRTSPTPTRPTSGPAGSWSTWVASRHPTTACSGSGRSGRCATRSVKSAMEVCCSRPGYWLVRWPVPSTRWPPGMPAAPST